MTTIGTMLNQSRLDFLVSTIESDINCLEQHGLNRCPDKGLSGYKRYVGLGVLAFNLHRIGAALLSARSGAKGRRRQEAA